MWLGVILLSTLVVQTQVTPEASVLVTKHGSDDVMLWGQGTADGRMFEYSVSKAEFGRLPGWEVEKSPPPLAIARAVEIAKKATRAEHPELTELMPWTISIHQVGSRHRQGRWFYIVNMYPLEKGEPSIDSEVTVVVLMDGTVVKPRERKKFAE